MVFHKILEASRNRGSLPIRASSWAICVGITALLIAVGSSRAEAQIPGCCYCDNCPQPAAPFCTDLMASSSSCVDLCIIQSGCQVIVFSPSEMCSQGCGDRPPYFSPTPTPSPTPPSTATPTNTSTPTITPTPPNTPTPLYCCQGSNPNRCGVAVPSNQPNCQSGEVPVTNASCEGGSCLMFTPTRTPTNTRPTDTPTSTPSSTPTRTPTATQTPTVTLGGFAIDPYRCYRAKATGPGSAAKGLEVEVVDKLGTRTQRVIKPFFVCSPADIDTDTANGMRNPTEFLTCYKAKDLSKANLGTLTVRNQFEQPNPVGAGTPAPIETPVSLELIKGDLLCIPSYVLGGLPTPTSPPAATPTSTP